MNTTTDILDRVNQVKYWRHRIRLPGGIVTPGYQTRWPAVYKLGLDGLVQGRSVLDIGAWDGALSFEVERCGAARVLATDVWHDAPFNTEWWNNLRNADEGFVCAKECLASNVEQMNISVTDLDPERVGHFEIILCLGVLYHIQHPLLALKKMRSVCAGDLLLECAVYNPEHEASAERTAPLAELLKYRGGWRLMALMHRWFPSLQSHAVVPPPEQPVMRFRGEAGWYPTLTCLENMIKVAGFEQIERVRPDSNKAPAFSRDDVAMEGETIRDTTMNVELDSVGGNGGIALPPGEKLQILGTERGTMDLENPEARFCRVELWSKGKRQGWVARDDVKILPQETYSHTTFERKREQIKRVYLRASVGN